MPPRSERSSAHAKSDVDPIRGGVGGDDVDISVVVEIPNGHLGHEAQRKCGAGDETAESVARKHGESRHCGVSINNVEITVVVDVDELDGARDRRADEDLGRGPEAAAAGSKRDEEGSARVRGDGDIDVAIFIDVAHRHRVGARRGDRRRRGEPAAGSEKDLHLSRVANGNVGQPIVIEVRRNDVARCGADERERRCSEARCHTLLSERAAGEHTQDQRQNRR